MKSCGRGFFGFGGGSGESPTKCCPRATSLRTERTAQAWLSLKATSPTSASSPKFTSVLSRRQATGHVVRLAIQSVLTWRAQLGYSNCCRSGGGKCARAELVASPSEPPDRPYTCGACGLVQDPAEMQKIGWNVLNGEALLLARCRMEQAFSKAFSLPSVA